VSEPSRTTWTIWLGRALSAAPVLMMLLSCTLKLTHAPQMVDSWGSKFGWPAALITPVGLIELTCVVVYVIPPTAVLGAILMSGYLAAAFSTHLRIEDPSGVIPVFLGVCAWGGLYFRDARIRALIPIRRNP
jgi:hypothetical protein